MRRSMDELVLKTKKLDDCYQQDMVAADETGYLMFPFIGKGDVRSSRNIVAPSDRSQIVTAALSSQARSDQLANAYMQPRHSFNAYNDSSASLRR